MLKTVFLVALGGGVGSVMRYLTTFVVSKCYAHVSTWPVRPWALGALATLLTNIIGCFLIGLFVGHLSKNDLLDSNLNWFLVTGFCGGYTTFSAFGLENVTLLQSGNSGWAFLNIAASIIVGMAAVYVGLIVSK